MLPVVHAEKTRLDGLFTEISSVGNTELQAHWAKYLCILTSGFIENSFRNIISEYARGKSAPIIASFVTKKIQGITNLKHNNLKSALDSLSPEWGNKFEQNISAEQKDAIDSVVANRHLIAHGRNIGITYVRIKNYYDEVVIVINLVYNIVNNRI